MQKKATTGQNFNYGLPLKSFLLEAAIIKILRTRGLHAQIVVKFDDCGFIDVSCLKETSIHTHNFKNSSSVFCSAGLVFIVSNWCCITIPYCRKSCSIDARFYQIIFYSFCTVKG